MENVRKHRDSKVETNETRKNYLVSKPKYYAYMFFFSEKLLAIEMEKTLMPMNKPVYLGLPILALVSLRETKISRKSLDTESFKVYIKPEDTYVDIANVVEARYRYFNL